MVIMRPCQGWDEGSIPFTYSNECFNEYCFTLVVSKQTCRYEVMVQILPAKAHNRGLARCKRANKMLSDVLTSFLIFIKFYVIIFIENKKRK